MYISERVLLEQFQHSFNSSLQIDGGYHKPAVSGVAKGDRLTEEVDKIKSFASSLYKKYEEHVKDMPDNWVKRNTVIAMENYKRATAYMDEATKTTALANFDRYAFPLIRAVIPTLATNKLFSIQQMFGPTSQIFYFDPVYGSTRGSVTAGQKMFENHDPHYGDSIIDLEVIGTGDGATVQFTCHLGYIPVVPGTLTITAPGDAADMTVTDDGNGNIIGDVANDGDKTINYNTGEVKVKFSAAVSTNNSIEAQYNVDTEANEDGIPQVDLVLTSSPVIARSKKLRMRWSLESQYALRDNLGLDAEAELVTATGAEIAYGIDSVNVDNVKSIALDKRLDTDFQFDRKTPTGVSFTEHKHELVDYLIKGSDYILQQSGRAIGNWVIGGSTFCNIIESLAPRFKPAAVIPATRGILELGVLDGRWTIFKDLRMQTDEYLIGFKGEQFLFAGYVWAPWITAFTTPTSVLDDMQGRKGIGSLYGQKIVNPKYYLRMKVVKST